jgi:hypothetical protein
MSNYLQLKNLCLQGCDCSELSPRVARSARPWAGSSNRVAIDNTNGKLPSTTWYSTENGEESQNENLTAVEMGNSPAVVFKRYRALVKPEDADMVSAVRAGLLAPDSRLFHRIASCGLLYMGAQDDAVTHFDLRPRRARYSPSPMKCPAAIFRTMPCPPIRPGLRSFGEGGNPQSAIRNPGVLNPVAKPSCLPYFRGMTEIETQLLQTLLQLEKAVETMPAANPKPDLRPLLAQLDELAKQLPASADPQLRHFLQRKSYEKARLFLQESAGG